MPDARTIFADGILEASVTHGVVRLTLAQAGADGKPLPAGQLVMPLTQLPAFANGLVNLLRQVESKMKEAQGGGGQSPAGNGGGEGSPPNLSGAFRFGS
ncbi:hypothetical protein [Crenalkalicoccus roseus]|jgi:hypothetical protein|uniref:hypothetical protein n=1 Tax=Crenalkalicoccus roseus TaxID=1485588 RepID=UPI00107FEAC6|nr:hypothetical protein [Crenalkalicoccus roseus]